MPLNGLIVADIKMTSVTACIDNRMLNNTRFLTKIPPTNWLLVFCLFQLIVWTFGPWLVRSNLVYDTMESLVWGQQWQWGYDKHPPFTAWMTALFGKLTTPPDFPVYLLAQLCVVITYLSVWRLAKEYLDDKASVLSVIMLSGVLYYSNLVERVTPDTMQSPIWALLALTLFLAVQKASLVFWLLSGVLIALGILTKYQIVVFIIPFMIPFLFSQKGRNSLKTSGPWLAALVTLLLISPHIYWLYEHDFPAFQYLNDQYIAHDKEAFSNGYNHIKYPFEFALSNLGNVILLALIGLPLFKLARKPSESVTTNCTQDTRFKTLYLYAIALGPFLVTLLFGLINGETLVPRWATPYFAWLPLLILFRLNKKFDSHAFIKIIINCFVVGLLMFTLRMSYIYFKPYYKDDYWQADEYTPSKLTLRKAEELWSDHYSNPLPFIGGDHYHVISISANSAHNIIPFSNLSTHESPWMTDQDFRRKGGIIVNETNRRTNGIKDRISKDYPKAVYLGTYSFRPFVPDDIENAIHSKVEFYLLKPET